jgi:hypothetical protein
MLRIAAGAGSVLLLGAAGFFVWRGMAHEEMAAIPEAPPEAGAPADTSSPPRTPPSADERTREQRRFDRVDRDNDGKITLAELTYPRQRAFQRLDADHNGQLSFQEWAGRTLQKFSQADANHDAALNRAEFATTAPRRRTPARQARCNCAQAAPAPAADDES